jgi:hypothetical protein
MIIHSTIDDASNCSFFFFFYTTKHSAILSMMSEREINALLLTFIERLCRATARSSSFMATLLKNSILLNHSSYYINVYVTYIKALCASEFVECMMKIRNLHTISHKQRWRYARGIAGDSLEKFFFPSLFSNSLDDGNCNLS